MPHLSQTALRSTVHLLSVTNCSFSSSNKHLQQFFCLETILLCFIYSALLKASGMQVERSIEQEEDSRGKPTWKHMTADFLSSSTIHGLNHLTGTKHGIARAVWLVLVLFHLVYLTYYLSGNVKKLMAYDTVVSTRLQHSKTLSFPAITICNKNNVRKSKIKDHELAGAILLNTVSITETSERCKCRKNTEM